jgi:phosphate transport system permease protein
VPEVAEINATTRPHGRWRRWKDAAVSGLTQAAAGGSLLLVLGLVVGLLYRAWPILVRQPLSCLLLSSDWQPLQGQFGFYPFILGTLWVTILAMLIATPLCLLTAVYLAEYADKRVRNTLKPLIDLLAGIPSVVYGLWGVLVIVPFVKDVLGPFAERHWSGLPWLAPQTYVTGYCVLSGALVLALMVTPVILSVAEEVLRSVSLGVREASLAVGATRWQTVKHTVLRQALPGLIAAVVLGFSRAFGETMAVLMVVGNVPFPPASIFDPAYPLPALIANNYGEMMSVPLYDSALLLAALVLLVVVLGFNALAQLVLRHVERRAM